MPRPHHPLLVALVALLIAALTAAAPAQEDAAAAAPDAVQTISDPMVDLAVLDWQLKPLRSAELEQEAEAWLGILQAKVSEISDVEVQSLQAEGDARSALLEQANELREQRTAIIDRVNAVLAALERKGGDVAQHRNYVSAVSGIKVDVTDTSAAWTTIVGWLESEQGGIRWAKNIGGALAVLVAFWILARILGGVVRRALERVGRTSNLLRAFLVNVTRKAIMIIGLILAASMLEINIGPLLAAIGAAGFILAFALQDTLGNLAAGIMILLYRPFDVGDAVNVAGVSGKVQNMSLSSTTITTFDNQLVIVPNKSIWGNVITNVTGSATRRIDMTFGIGYGDDAELARRVLEEITTSHPLVLKDPAPVIQLNELGDSSVNFIVRPWSKTADYWAVYWDITKAVKQRFDAEGISIPFPQRDVHVYQHEPQPAGL